MKSITVCNNNSESATSVWYEPASGQLSVLFGSILRVIRLDLVPAGDFDSDAAVTHFSLGQGGSVVVCHHADGEQTWLPVDMWWPGGFTPSDPAPRGRKIARVPDHAAELVKARRRVGLSQSDAARVGSVPLRTLQQWEQGRQEPPADRAAAYLKALVTAPPRRISWGLTKPSPARSKKVLRSN